MGLNEERIQHVQSRLVTDRDSLTVCAEALTISTWIYLRAATINDAPPRLLFYKHRKHTRRIVNSGVISSTSLIAEAVHDDTSFIRRQEEKKSWDLDT